MTMDTQNSNDAGKTTPDRCSVYFVDGAGREAELFAALSAFLEAEFGATLVAGTENGDLRHDLRSIRKDLAQCGRVIVPVSEQLVASRFYRLQLRQLRSTPEHLLSIFPVQLDDTPIPEEVSHRQAFRLSGGTAGIAGLEQQLREWLEHDGAETFQAEQQAVNSRLCPLSPARRLDDFLSSPTAFSAQDEKLLERIDAWDASSASPRILAVEGASATGKSRLICRLLFERGDKILAVRFLNRASDAESGIRRTIMDIAAQFAAGLAQYRSALLEALKNDVAHLDLSSLFNILVLEPLRRENPNRNYWMVLDGIESVNDAYGQNQLLGMLVQSLSKLPQWLKIIVTHRPDANISLLLRGIAEPVRSDESGGAAESGYRLNDAEICPHPAEPEPTASDAAEDPGRLPVFISYGHDEHTGKVVAIREALVKRGHRVWIDREGIPLGSDWRRKIYDGIRNSRLFLAFLSRHSVNSEYCRTEIRIALGAPDHLMPTLPLKLENVDIPQTLKANARALELTDWPDPQDSAAFAAAMRGLENWVDAGGHAEFCREIDTLSRRLEPFSFEARLGELLNSPFVGRMWLLPLIDRWDKSDSRLFGLIGGPGFGKSIFAANLRALCPEKVVAAQFIEWNMPSLFSARRIIRSLAFQLAARLDGYRHALIEELNDIKRLGDLEDDELFERLLTIPLQHETADSTRWIIIDALDEATDKRGGNPFVATLVRNLPRLPSWLKLFVTSRSDKAVVPLLEHYKLQRFDTDDAQQYQRADMLEYILSSLKPLVPAKDADSPVALSSALAEIGFTSEVINALADKSQNIFLYLRIVCQSIVAGNCTAQEAMELPSGASSMFLLYFTRQYSGERYPLFRDRLRPLLELGAACREEITIELLCEAAAANGSEITCGQTEEILSSLGTLGEISPLPDGRRQFQFIHRSIWEWLTTLPEGAAFKIDRAKGEAGMCRFCLRQIDRVRTDRPEPASVYALNNVIFHLAEIGDEKHIWELLGGPEPKLPRLQTALFGNSAGALASCRAAIDFYLDRRADGHAGEYSGKICRLLVTRNRLETDGFAIALRRLEKSPLTVRQTIETLELAPDPGRCLMLGCIILSRGTFTEPEQDMILDYLERNCADAGKYRQLQKFLIFGPLTYSVDRLSEENFLRLVEMIGPLYQLGSRLSEHIEPEMFDLDRADGSLPRSKQREKQREISKIKDPSQRCEETLDFAKELFEHGYGEDGNRWLERAVSLLKKPLLEYYWRAADGDELLEHAADLYIRTDRRAAACELVSACRNIFPEYDEPAFTNRYGTDGFGLAQLKTNLSEECYTRIADDSLRHLAAAFERAHDVLDGGSVLSMLELMGRNGRGDACFNALLRRSPDLASALGSLYVRLFDRMIADGQGAAVAVYLKKLHRINRLINGKDYPTGIPTLLTIMDRLKAQGHWSGDVPDRRRIIDAFVEDLPDELRSKAEAERISLADFLLWLLEGRVPNDDDSCLGIEAELSDAEKAELFEYAVNAGVGSAEDNDTLVAAAVLLQVIEALEEIPLAVGPDTAETLAEALRQITSAEDEGDADEDDDEGGFSLFEFHSQVLQSGLSPEILQKHAEWCEKLLEEHPEKDSENTLLTAIVGVYVSGGLVEKVSDVLEEHLNDDNDKIVVVFHAVTQMLDPVVKRPRQELPESDEVLELCRSWMSTPPEDDKSASFSFAVKDVAGALASAGLRSEAIRGTVAEALLLCLHQGDGSPPKLCDRVIGSPSAVELCDSAIGVLSAEELIEALDRLHVAVSDRQKNRWQLLEAIKTGGSRDIALLRSMIREIGIESNEDERAEDTSLLLRLLETGQNGKLLAQDGIADDLNALICRIASRETRNECLMRLLRLTMLHDLPQFVALILSEADNRALAAAGEILDDVDADSICATLERGRVDDRVIGRVLAPRMKRLSFEKLCRFCRFLILEPEFAAVWSAAFFAELDAKNDYETARMVLTDCPEFSMREFVEDSPPARVRLLPTPGVFWSLIVKIPSGISRLTKLIVAGILLKRRE